MTCTEGLRKALNELHDKAAIYVALDKRGVEAPVHAALILGQLQEGFENGIALAAAALAGALEEKP